MHVVLDFFDIHGLTLDSERPIVAFGKNTSHIHYFPQEKGSKRLEKETLILLDIWARLKKSRAPYADFTWMFYYGDLEPDPAYQETFSYVAKSRDAAISYIKKEIKEGGMPIGAMCDKVARDFFRKKNLHPYFMHTLGHSLGTKSPHGIYGGPRPRTKTPLVKNLGYTIEPGLYFAGKYGCRSEIDLYISEKNEVITTLPLQKKIQIIRP